MAIDQSTATLDPKFRVLVEQLFKKIREAGIQNAYIWEGRRTLTRQYELFGKGRTAATLRKYWVPVQYANPKAKIVTWTLHSKHLEWKAIDIVFDSNPDPKVKSPRWSWDYAKIISIAKTLWIRSLAPIELAHFEI